MNPDQPETAGSDCPSTPCSRLSEAIAYVRKYNDWRRGKIDWDDLSPADVGRFLDTLCDEAEMVERERDELGAEADEWRKIAQRRADNLERCRPTRMSAQDDGITPGPTANGGAVPCSPCCGAKVQVTGDYVDGTRWYQCTLCLRDCDPIQVRQLGRVWAARRGYNTALGGTKMDAIRGILDQANDNCGATEAKGTKS